MIFVFLISIDKICIYKVFIYLCQKSNKMKQVKGYENYYIDTDGSVYRNWDGKFKKLKPSKKSIYMPADNSVPIHQMYMKSKSKAYFVTLCKDGKAKSIKLSRLVLQTYSPLPDDKDYIVKHKDGNPENCSVSNLYWMQNKGIRGAKIKSWTAFIYHSFIRSGDKRYKAVRWGERVYTVRCKDKVFGTFFDWDEATACRDRELPGYDEADGTGKIWYVLNDDIAKKHGWIK